MRTKEEIMGKSKRELMKIHEAFGDRFKYSQGEVRLSES